MLWLVIQLLALALAAFRAPLSARFPPPGEQFALHVMLATQVVGSALLFPLLLRDVRTSIIAIVAMAPCVQLSAYLSSIPAPRAALAALHVAVWLMTLAVWRSMLTSRRGQMLGVACALAVSLGGAILWYLEAETREPGVMEWSHDGAFGPVLGSLAQLHTAPASSWTLALLLLACSAVAAIATRRRGVGGSGDPRAMG